MTLINIYLEVFVEEPKSQNFQFFKFSAPKVPWNGKMTGVFSWGDKFLLLYVILKSNLKKITKILVFHFLVLGKNILIKISPECTSKLLKQYIWVSLRSIYSVFSISMSLKMKILHLHLRSSKKSLKMLGYGARKKYFHKNLL